MSKLFQSTDGESLSKTEANLPEQEEADWKSCEGKGAEIHKSRWSWIQNTQRCMSKLLSTCFTNVVTFQFPLFKSQQHL